MNPQQSFLELQDAKDALKIAKNAYKDAMESDSTLSDLAEVKKQAAADYKSERQQFDGRNAALVEKIADLTDDVKQVKLTFDETVEMAVRRGEQLTLFTKDGKEVSVHLTTRLTIEKDVKKEAAEEATDDVDA